MDSLKGTILQYHVWSRGTNYSAEDSLGGQFFKVFFVGGDHLVIQYHRATAFNHLCIHIPLGNWFLCDVICHPTQCS